MNRVICEIQRVIEVRRREFLPQLTIRVGVKDLDRDGFIMVCKHFGEKGWDVEPDKENTELVLTPRCLI